MVLSIRWTGLWIGSLDWTAGLDCWTDYYVYHMTSTQSDVLNWVTRLMLSFMAICKIAMKRHVIVGVLGSKEFER